MSLSHATNSAFDHAAIFHDGPKDLAVRVAPALAGAIARGEPVHVSLTGDQWAHLEAELGNDAQHLHQLPAADRYTNPGVAMAAVHRFITQAVDTGAEQVWSIGAVPFQNEPTDSRWVRYEAAVDHVLGHLPLRGICTYDLANTPEHVAHAVRCSHAVIDEPGDGRQASPHYGGALPSIEVPIRPPGAPMVAHTVSDVTSTRHELTGALDGALSRERMDDFRLIATEMITNAMRHGTEPVDFRAWVSPTAVVIEVTDHGPGVDDRFADLRPLDGGCHGGFGMWLIGQLADQVWIGREGNRTLVTASLWRDRHNSASRSGHIGVHI